MRLYVDIYRRKLVKSPTSPADPEPLYLRQGETLPVKIFFLDSTDGTRTNPFPADYSPAGATVKLGICEAVPSGSADTLLAYSEAFALSTDHFAADLQLNTVEIAAALKTVSAKICTLEIEVTEAGGAPIKYVQAGIVIQSAVIDANSLVPALSTSLADLIHADGSIPFLADQSLGNHKLTNVANPVAGGDAANKAWTLAQIPAAGPGFSLEGVIWSGGVPFTGPTAWQDAYDYSDPLTATVGEIVLIVGKGFFGDYLTLSGPHNPLISYSGLGKGISVLGDIIAPGFSIELNIDGIDMGSPNSSSTTGPGGDITISGQNSETGQIISWSTAGKGGNVSVQGNIFANGIDSHSTAADGGYISLETMASAEDLDSSSTVGAGGEIDIESGSKCGEINASGFTQGGNVNLLRGVKTGGINAAGMSGGQIQVEPDCFIDGDITSATTDNGVAGTIDIGNNCTVNGTISANASNNIGGGGLITIGDFCKISGSADTGSYGLTYSAGNIVIGKYCSLTSIDAGGFEGCASGSISIGTGTIIPGSISAQNDTIAGGSVTLSDRVTTGGINTTGLNGGAVIIGDFSTVSGDILPVTLDGATAGAVTLGRGVTVLGNIYPYYTSAAGSGGVVVTGTDCNITGDIDTEGAGGGFAAGNITLGQRTRVGGEVALRAVGGATVGTLTMLDGAQVFNCDTSNDSGSAGGMVLGNNVTAQDLKASATAADGNGGDISVGIGCYIRALESVGIGAGNHAGEILIQGGVVTVEINSSGGTISGTVDLTNVVCEQLDLDPVIPADVRLSRCTIRSVFGAAEFRAFDSLFESAIPILGFATCNRCTFKEGVADLQSSDVVFTNCIFTGASSIEAATPQTITAYGLLLKADLGANVTLLAGDKTVDANLRYI